MTTKLMNLKRKRGQNTAEYMLLLLLIGGGSIIAFKTFGKGIINRFASVTSIVTGGQAIGMDANTISSANSQNVDFKTFDGPAGATGSTPPTP